MGIKKSVYLHDDTVRIMQQMSGNVERVKWSELINNSIAACHHIYKTSAPYLTPDEICLIYPGINSNTLKPPYNLAGHVLDHNKTIKDAGFIKRLHEMSQLEQFSIILMLVGNSNK